MPQTHGTIPRCACLIAREPFGWRTAHSQAGGDEMSMIRRDEARACLPWARRWAAGYPAAADPRRDAAAAVAATPALKVGGQPLASASARRRSEERKICHRHRRHDTGTKWSRSRIGGLSVRKRAAERFGGIHGGRGQSHARQGGASGATSVLRSPLSLSIAWLLAAAVADAGGQAPRPQAEAERTGVGAPAVASASGQDWRRVSIRLTGGLSELRGGDVNDGVALGCTTSL